MNAHEIVATATRLLAEPERPRGPWITVDEAASLAGDERSTIDPQRHAVAAQD